MGQQPDIPQEGKWQVKDMPRPKDLNKAITCENQKAPTLEEIARCPHRSHQVLQGRQQQGLLWDAPYGGSVAPHNIQHPPWKVQIPTCPLWTQNVTGHLPNEDG